MAITFPTSLDVLTNPTAATALDDGTTPHHGQHADANDAIEALETKVGINGSAVEASLDYLVKSSLSVNPGHKHPGTAITSVVALATDADTLDGSHAASFGILASANDWTHTNYISKSDIAALKVGSTPAFQVDTTNIRVGVGIAPTVGSLAGERLTVNCLSGGVMGNNGIGVYFSAGTYGIRGSIRHGGNGSGYLSAGGLQIAAQGTSNSANGSGNIKFLTSTGNSAGEYVDATLAVRMTILYSGQIGIGMTPTYSLDVTGNFRCSTGFACNGTLPQTAYASGGAVATSAGGFGFGSDAERSSLTTLVANIRTALVANGIMS